MRPFLLAAALLALSACMQPTGTDAAPTPPPAGGSSCGADRLASFVGKVATADVRAKIADTVGHDSIRWLGPDTAVTMDYSESRLNVAMDANRKIIRAYCG